MFAVALLIPLAGLAGTASARDCLKGAAIGGVAGHVAGKHGVLGAAAGCAIAHHRAKVKDKQAARAAAAQANSNGARTPPTAPRKRTTTL
jgi:hypothetical protein